MDERWRKVDRLFHDVLDMPPDQRDVYLNDACGADADLRAEVRSLVASAEETGEFLDSPALGAQFTLLPVEPTHEDSNGAMADRIIGPYRLTQQIAAGGMGVVYLAKRADHVYEQQVAIKLIKRGMDSEQILHRFRQERQTLANLDHPHIAKLLDGGATEDGRPYLVMEHIDGLPIAEYCDRHRLSLTERLKLFESVCSAVHYAHQNLIIHRDLKPANIYVTREGVPKLLDFGIAKVLRDDRSNADCTTTSVEWRLLTPEYASPEQLLGQPMTTATDVYSLGVILYELLIGQRPYDLRHRPPSEIERAVCVDEPEKPSTATRRATTTRPTDGTVMEERTPESLSRLRGLTPDGLKRRLRGELDNIVMMAMRKDPRRRYASVEQFAEDLRRYREGRTVIAQRDTIRYRAAKFLRRNRVGVAAATLVVLSLLAGLAGVAREARATRIQRDVAKANLARAEEAERLAGEEAQRATAKAETAKQALEFLKDVFQNPDPFAVENTAVTAREILDRGVQRLETELRDQPTIRATLLDNMGWAYLNLGLLQRARELLEEALTLRLELYGEDHLEVAESLNGLGEIHRRTGNYAESASMQRRVLEIHRKLLNENDDTLARSLSNLALTLLEAGNHADAEPLIQEALAMMRKASTANTPGKWDVAESVLLNNLGGLRFEAGRYEEAEPLFRESLRLRRNALDARHPAVANAVHNVAKTVMRRGHADEALPMFIESLEIRRESLGLEHPNVAISLHWLGVLHFEQGDYTAAESYCLQALEIRRAKLPEGSTLTAETESLTGACLTKLGRYEEAEALLLRSLQVLESGRTGDDQQCQEARERLADLHRVWNRPASDPP